MNRHHLDQLIDDAAAEIRREKLAESVARNATDRVWKRLATERDALNDLGSSALQNATQNVAAGVDHIRGCDDFQALIRAYLSGQLSAARVLLFEDHTRECVPCRKAFNTARAGRQTSTAATQAAKAAATRPRNLWNPSLTKWAVAALVVAFGFVGMRLMQSVGALNAVVQAANGPIYRVSEARTVPVNAGEKIQKGERIRTAKGARAVVKLADGSLVEISERAEFYVTENGGGTTIHLDRGNVIVQAAKQKSGHLFVQTDDALVSVKGTIFSVNSGTKGSRVSVIEGEVHVDHSSKQDVLRPGDQVTTSASIERVPVQEEISWSRDAARYLQLLNELAALKKDLNNVARPGLRTSTRLLDLQPAGTAFYAAIPNLSQTLADSYRLVEQRISQNDLLKEWWQKQGEARANSPAKAFDQIREFGAYLGEEVVLSAELTASGQADGPLVVAELRDAAGCENYLAQRIAGLPANQQSHIRLIADPLTATSAGDHEMLVWIHGDLLAASPNLPTLQRFAATLSAAPANSFKETSFYARIAERYQAGTGLLVAADLEKITPQLTHDVRPSGNAMKDHHEHGLAATRQLGLLNLKHFIAEAKEVDGKGQNNATVSFTEPNRGIAAWLAQPGPMGALDLISPDANVVAAFVVNQPTKLVDDLFAAMKTVEPKFEEHLAKFAGEHGINIRNDFAAPLGGEFAFAVDGPVLPTPSWKMIVEVYDSARLQQAIERLAEEINKYAQQDGKRGVALERAEASGRTYYTLKSLDLGNEISYTFANGYFIAAPRRALLDRALGYRDAGYTLTRSPRFVGALPADKQPNFSALVYHNLGSVVAPLSKQGAVKLPSGGQQALEALASAAPTLAYAYNYGDRVVMSLGGDGVNILNPATWLNLPGGMALQGMLNEAAKQEGAAGK